MFYRFLESERKGAGSKRERKGKGTGKRKRKKRGKKYQFVVLLIDAFIHHMTVQSLVSMCPD